MVAVNLNREAYDVRIDRKTKWGNPFVMRHESERDAVIAKYRDYLWMQIERGSITLDELASLHGKKLGCHCAPKACHGDVLTAAAEWAAKEIKK